MQLNFLINPITALTPYYGLAGRTLALAGEDAWLKVYDVDTNELLGQLRIFHSQSIHGIYVSPSDESDVHPRVLIWGGHSVAILSQTALQTIIEGRTPPILEELRAPDWIYDGILFASSGLAGALVTAHNEIVPILRNPDNTSFSFGSLTSPSRPILYSANLCLLSPDTVLVAGGTVFGEIIVWKYHLGSARPSRYEVLYVFTGHEGSIFGVSISPELEIAPGTKIRLLASCSDDRTVRVWDITDRSEPGAIEEGIAQTKLSQEARETGFGGVSNSEVKSENKNDSERCVAVEMGHISRIWHVKFSGRTSYSKKPVEFYSFGEDCTRQKWELSLDVQPETRLGGQLRNCGGVSCHEGKNIWSAAVSQRGQQLLMLSGGADGRIAVSGGGEAPAGGTVEGSPLKRVVDAGEIRFTFDEFLQAVKSPIRDGDLEVIEGKHFAKEGFYRYLFLSETSLLVTAASGRLFIGTFSAEEPPLWEEISVPVSVRRDIASFHMLVSPVDGTAVFGTMSGRLYLLNEARELKELAAFPAKITDIICPGRSSQTTAGSNAPETQILFVTTVGQDCTTRLEYETSTGNVLGEHTPIGFDNGYEKYVMTAAGYCGRYLIFGSRVGALSLYSPSEESWTLVETRKDCKGKDAISCILPLPGSSTAFLTTCRDGRYRIYTIEDRDGNPTMHLQHEISPPLALIEGAQFSMRSGSYELILYGFRGTYFVAWNETLRQELAAVECGGANRPFSYKSSLVEPGKLLFIYRKVSHTGLYTQTKPALRVLKEGAHGREIRAVAACEVGYVATAAEDTTIRIWQYKDSPNPTSRGFKCLAVMEKHSAGIQALKWHGSNYLISSAGSEELFIWHVTRIDSDYDAIAVVCEAAYPDRTADGDLRIMNFDVQNWGTENNEMLISLVLSNSTVRAYQYSKQRGFKLLSTGHYTGACLTQIRHLHASEAELHVLTASTDGYLALWSSARNEDDASAAYTTFSLATATKLHQSTIKSMDIVLSPSPDAESLPPNRFLAITGGDDNALGLLDISFSSSTGTFAILNKSRIKSAHAAAVTGLSILRTGEEGVDVATVSNDQRMKVWKVIRRGEDGKEGVRVQMREDRYSSIADPGDLEVICHGRLMVGGVGVEVWEV